jgi:hypothetical protein
MLRIILWEHSNNILKVLSELRMYSGKLANASKDSIHMAALLQKAAGWENKRGNQALALTIQNI